VYALDNALGRWQESRVALGVQRGCGQRSWWQAVADQRIGAYKSGWGPHSIATSALNASSRLTCLHSPNMATRLYETLELHHDASPDESECIPVADDLC
jgi:hypothetical protein